MNDIILTALMQLSALVAQINQTHFHKNAHVLVKSYLEKSLGPKNIRSHLKQYFEFFKQYESEIKDLISKNNAENNIHILHRLCESLNKELTLNDRYVLMLSFLELIYIDKVITHEEQEFIGVLANKFKIGHEDFLNACDFIFNPEPIRVHSSNYLVICDTDVYISDELEGSWITKNKPTHETHHTIHHKGLNNKIYILKFVNSELLTLKYSGESPVFLTNNKIEQGKYYILSTFDQLFINNKSISIHEINYTFQNEKNVVQLILKGKDITLQPSGKQNNPEGKFNFCEESGNIVAVLGDTVTTSKLIQLLSGRSTKIKLDICLNGYNIYNDYYKIQKLIGYVPNYSIFNENISIYQNLYLNSKLSFPQLSEAKIISWINEIIETTKLGEVSNTIPSKLKNSFDPLFQFLTNLAIELVHDPWLLFIDAPLDKLTIPEHELVLKILRLFTAKGKLVFITCNQPNSIIFEYCNKLWIIDQHDYLIYSGHTHHVFDYFNSNSDNVIQTEEHCSFCGSVKPELLNQIINQKTIDENGELTTRRKTQPKEWHALYKEKIEKTIIPKECKKVLPLHLGSIPTIHQQYFVYLKKIFASNKPRILSHLKEISAFSIICLILGFMFRSDWSANYLAGNNPNLHIFIIFSIIAMFILGIVIAENENHKEKKQIYHEIKKNLSFFSYLNAQLSWLLILSAVYSLIYAFIGTLILGITEYFSKYWLICFTLSALGNVVGILLSNLFAKRKIVYFALLVLVVFNILFNGLTINSKTFPKPLSSNQYTPAITEFSPVKWAFEALYVEHVINNNYEKLFYNLDQKIENSLFNANYLIPELQQKLTQITGNSRSKEYNKILLSIQNEIKQFASNSEIFPFEYINDLSPEKVNNNILKETSDYLTYIQLVLSESIQKLTQQKHTVENKLIDSIGASNYLLFKKKYFNTYLFDLANKFNAAINVRFSNGEIVKSMNPLYLVPSSNFGRAHLFAPVKIFNYFYYNTFWFNLFILWWFVFILFIFALICYPSSRTLKNA